MQIKYTAPQHVRDIITSLDRTEDLRFSPNNRRLVILGYAHNKIALIEIDITDSSHGVDIHLENITILSSNYLKEPHGVDFIDDQTIVVANRDGGVSIFQLPVSHDPASELTPIGTISVGDSLNSPGSIAVHRKSHGVYELLVCNNYVNRVTSHLVHPDKGFSVDNSRVILEKWLDIPDGICVSKDMRWIAVSNHHTNSVFIYENSPLLNELSDPSGILRGVFYPHGLRFTPDGRFIFVADAGAPYVHIYEREGLSWRGVRNPLASFRTMTVDDFLRGHFNPMQGGPKGIDIDNGMRVMVTTCECQSLAFFDLTKILEKAPLFRVSHREDFRDSISTGEQRGEIPSFGPEDGYHHDQSAWELRFELGMLDKLNGARMRADQAEAQAAEASSELASLIDSRSWRITAPLRGLYSFMRRLFETRA